jgi:putative tricarboxylic transport membrane protein
MIKTVQVYLARRAILAAGLAIAGLTTFTSVPSAQAAIDQLKIMAPAAPGGGWDTTARTMQTALIQGGVVKNVQVNNVTGAGGTIGLASLVNNMKGDGNQLMVMGLVMVGAILSNKSPVTLEQTTPIARLTGEYELVVVPTNSKLKDMKDLVAELKKNPGAVSWGGGSAGGTDHILVGLIAKAVGVDPTKVNYIAHSGGGEAMANILGGKVTAGVSGYGEFAPQIQAKRLRVLAVSAPERIAGLDAPTLKEQGIDVELANWRAVVAPPGLNDQQKKDLIDVVDRMHKTKQWQEALKKNDWADLYLAGDQFGAFLKEEDKRVTEILKSIGLAK